MSQKIEFNFTISGSLTLPDEPESRIFDLFLSGVDESKKIKSIKGVRTLTGLGLKDAKEMVERILNFDTPVRLLSGIESNLHVRKLKHKAEQYGLTVDVRVSDDRFD